MVACDHNLAVVIVEVVKNVEEAFLSLGFAA
jgi:hypothetical protein